MSIESGWDFEEDLDDLFYPEHIGVAIMNFITLPIRILIVSLIVIPLSYLIASCIGFFNLGESK